MPEVPVNGKVLEWARKIRGLEIEQAAELLGIQAHELREYESGAKKPLVGFLRKMSARYRVNFTSLLMPEPLPIEKPATDHRERHGRHPLSMDTLIAYEDVNEALDAFEDIADEAPRIVPKLSIGTAHLDDDPEAVAIRERKRFGVSVDQQKLWRGLADARRRWRELIEDHGVFTYMIPMQPPEELSGFSILRDNLAAICINDRESTEGAKIFTLFHEYCHLLLRNTGISDENNSNRTERFCNDFAAAFLIPRNRLRQEAGEVETPYEFSDAEVKRLAGRFRVSNRAMALRLEKTGFAPSGFYARRTGPWDVPSEIPYLPPSAQPSHVRIRLKRIGQLHARTVLQAVERRVINSFDASVLIGLKPASFGKVQAALE